jgi:DNA integrity scanning protein DisA with diadenylate cyclase activity
MASSKSKLTEDQLREGIISKLMGHIFNKRTTKALNLLSKESPALARANKRYEKASKELGDSLRKAAKHRLKRKDREMY